MSVKSVTRAAKRKPLLAQTFTNLFQKHLIMLLRTGFEVLETKLRNLTRVKYYRIVRSFYMFRYFTKEKSFAFMVDQTLCTKDLLWVIL